MARDTEAVAAFHPGRGEWPFGRRPPSRDGNGWPRAGDGWRAPVFSLRLAAQGPLVGVKQTYPEHGRGVRF